MQQVRETNRKWQAACSAVGLFAFCMGLLVGSGSAKAEAPQISKVGVTAVTGTSATIKATIDPRDKNTTFSFEYGTTDCATPKACKVAAKVTLTAGSGAKEESVALSGLTPATLYHFRILGNNAKKEETAVDGVFATLVTPLGGLPDGRAYEQASPVNKDGGDVLGDVPTIKATFDGSGITFDSTFGVPGGKGAQEFPTYLGSRGSSNWSTQGLLPPPSAGERAQVIGWSPNYTEVFSNVTKLEAKRMSALIVQDTAGGAPVQITPYVANTDFYFSGESQDGSVVLFETRTKLTASALSEFPNLYAWDRETGQITLAGALNGLSAGISPPKGAIAGSYEWTEGITALSLRLGGSFRGFYLQDEHAITPDGSIFFTEAGTGQLYERINPTAEQSPLSEGSKGKCTDPAKACTIHISQSHRSTPDGAGPQPAAFQAASQDGKEVFLTSPEKLTDDANTGPEQPPAQIEEGSTSGPPITKPAFIPRHAIGVAVFGTKVYWVDPTKNTIGRADLDGNNIQDSFIEPGTTECEFETEPGVFETEELESRPRYLTVAADGKHIYWTNTGCSDEFGPIGGTGTIGRADIEEATPKDIEPEFIKGASNPQGIAVNEEDIYWANSGRSAGVRAIGRARIEGEEVKEVNQEFIQVSANGLTPSGVALSPTHIYFSANEDENDHGYIGRVPLNGGAETSLFVGKAGIRGISVDNSNVYWTTQGEEAIGRADLELKAASKTNKFIPLAGKLNGVAVDGTHLYWANNGEAPTNPGNDLYRYGPGEEELTDLTPDSADENGAEVQGVVAASDDGRYIYFAANGVLAAGAKAGDCEGTVGSTTGSCSLYLWHAGTINLVGRLKGSPTPSTDALNWTATPRSQFGTASYVPKTSFTSADGQTLIFRSQEKLTSYENEGVPELYRFRVGQGISCVSCNPTGEAAGEGPKMGQVKFPALGPLASVAAVSSRNLSASGNQVFFETQEALNPADTNGQGEEGKEDCPIVGAGEQDYPACTDVYEWEAPGAGSCKEASPSYSPLNGGCIYLISTGKSKFPSLFADASASGNDVFFFTRQALVGQDKDELQDVYDARVGGGLPAQNPVVVEPCVSTEACHGPAQTPPAQSSPATPSFFGPANEVQKHKKQKAKKKKSKKHKGKSKKQEQKRR
jgi:hypothetical protein